MKKKKRKNLTTKWSNFYILITLFFVVGFAMFSTSKFYMAENLEVNQTELHKEYDLRANGKFMINDWKYDSEKNKMEITLVTNGIKNYKSDLDFLAVARTDLKNELPTEIVYNDSEIYIIHINNIPKDFQQVALRLLKSEISFDEIFEETESETENNEAIISTIYTDQRKVKHESIEQKDMREYAIEITSSMIDVNNEKIKKIEKQIQNTESVIESIESEITELKTEILYQTVDEQHETSTEITSLENEIKKYHSDIQLFNKDIENLNTKIEKLTQRKRDLSF